MIVQCRQCRTKFRFDDTQLQEEGVWLRCGRCRHVFYQQNPRIASSSLSAVSQTETAQETLGHGRYFEAPSETKPFSEPAPQPPPPTVIKPKEPSFVLADAHTRTESAEAQKPFTEPETRTPEDDHEAFDPTPRDPDFGLHDIALTNDRDEVSDDLADASEDSDEPASVPAPRKSGKAWRLALWSLLVLIVIPAVILFVAFPEVGQRYVDLGKQLVGLAEPAPEVDAIAGYVKIHNIRQRIVNSYIMGQIRVIEGQAVNQAAFPVTRVMIKAEIVDATGQTLGERVSYAGNQLTDDELMNLSEEAIQKRLSLPPARRDANDRVDPQKEIPFMIVFTREPPGSIKTTVSTIGAERLLQ